MKISGKKAAQIVAKFILVILKKRREEKTSAVFLSSVWFEKELYMSISIHSAWNTKKNAGEAHMIV